MTDPSQPSSGRDIGFPTSDQAGGVSLQHPQQLYGHYDADHNANAPGASDNPIPANLHDASMRYQGFDAHHQQSMPGQFSGYDFPPQAPLGWDWTNTIDFSDFTNQYEPQGELLGELQHTVTANDFSVPLPVTAVDSVYQAPYVPEAPTSSHSNAQNPLSPPPKPPSRPVVQTGMKRKADSEPDSAVSQTPNGALEDQQHPPKRQNKSRQSSAASLSSPIVTEPTDARQSPVAQAATQAPAEPASQGNAELSKKKEQSKGTGPQGRVIDVSKPRRVVESPGRSDTMLPAGKVFPIQIGSELFRLSGASISSDGMHSPHSSLVRFGKLRLLEHPHTFRISSAINYTTTAAALVT
jgi:hypothetical protein